MQHQRLVMQDGESAEKLPSDLLEEIATFLPLASLCRFRAVSKEWNRFISHPDFASRHARASSPEEFVFFSKLHQPSKQDWEVLDVANKRFFNFSNDFLAKFVKQQGILGRCPQARFWRSQRRTILAADGGLLCLSLDFDHESRSSCEPEMHEALLVCNPILKTVKQLPLFAGWLKRPEWVVMSTDRDSMEYEIFFITLVKDALQPTAVYIYQSKTASWRASAAVPGHLNALSGCLEPCPVSVILRDEFYALFIHHDGLHVGLVSYNKVTGAFSDLGIDVPCVGYDWYRVRPWLVVSDGRLFCVIMNLCFNAPTTVVTSIDIVEFILSRREYIHLSVLKGQMLEWFLGNYASAYYKFYGGPVVATGLANSIFLRSLAGRFLVYDLLDRTWHKFLDTSGTFEYYNIKSLGSNHCLSLCAP